MAAASSGLESNWSGAEAGSCAGERQEEEAIAERHQSGHHPLPDREQRGDTGVHVRGREQGDVTEDRGRRAGTLSTVGQGTVCGWVVLPPIVTS